jgi:hypothetical protein
MFDLFKPLQRKLTARALSRDGEPYPDILCLQEIESLTFEVSSRGSDRSVICLRGTTLRSRARIDRRVRS